MDNELLDLAISKMIKTDKLHRQLIESHVNSIGIYRTQHMILMILARLGHLPSQKELSTRLSITPAAVTGALKSLIKDGYIEKTIGEDNRYNEIMITKAGLEIVKRSKECFEAIDRSMFRGFTDDELKVYISFLDKIQNNIKESSESREILR